MDGYCIARQIEAAQVNKTVCIRFYAIENGKDVWIDGLEYANCGEDMEVFLTSVCNIEPEIAEKLSQSWDIASAKGFAEELCFKTGVFKWTQYAEISAALDDFDEEVVAAALKLGIPAENIADYYMGSGTPETFAIKVFRELSLSEIPEEYHKFLDWDSIAEYYGSDFTEQDGYVFDTTR